MGHGMLVQAQDILFLDAPPQPRLAAGPCPLPLLVCLMPRIKEQAILELFAHAVSSLLILQRAGQELRLGRGWGGGGGGASAVQACCSELAQRD